MMTANNLLPKNTEIPNRINANKAIDGDNLSTEAKLGYSVAHILIGRQRHVLITVGADSKSLTEWARLHGINKGLLSRRVSERRPLSQLFAASLHKTTCQNPAKQKYEAARAQLALEENIRWVVYLPEVFAPCVRGLI
jgi:hypothetical protein